MVGLPDRVPPAPSATLLPRRVTIQAEVVKIRSYTASQEGVGLGQQPIGTFLSERLTRVVNQWAAQQGLTVVRRLALRS